MISTNQCQNNSLHFIKVCKLVGLLETWYRINGNTLHSWFSHYKPALASQGYLGKILNNRKRPSFNIRHPHCRTVRHREVFCSAKYFHLIIYYHPLLQINIMNYSEMTLLTANKFVLFYNNLTFLTLVLLKQN